MGKVRTTLTQASRLANPASFNGSMLASATLYEYDSTGRLVNTAGAYENHVNGADNNTKSAATSTQQGRQATSYRYDIFGNLIEQRVHASKLAAHNSVSGNLTAPAQASADIVTRHEYNHLGQLTREVNALGQETVHHYNQQGLLAQSRTGLFRTTP